MCQRISYAYAHESQNFFLNQVFTKNSFSIYVVTGFFFPHTLGTLNTTFKFNATLYFVQTATFITLHLQMQVNLSIGRNASSKPYVTDLAH